MDLASFLNRSFSMAKVHIILMALMSFGKLVMVWSDFRRAFMMPHTFSMGLRSGLLLGQSMTENSFSFSRAMVALLL